MPQPITDEPLIIWPVYEPASVQRIELTAADLVQHVLLIGSTGSGKSTLLTSAIAQLILHQADQARKKIGLLVLDAKGDDLVNRVRAAAQAGKRAGDIVILGPQGDHGLDLFGGLQTLADVDRITRLSCWARRSLATKICIGGSAPPPCSTRRSRCW
jgi:energy-coupling factor transporter ATP-binding protein EcfA2